MSVRTVGLDLAKQVFLSIGVEISTPIDSPLHVAVQDPLAWFHSATGVGPWRRTGSSFAIDPQAGLQKDEAHGQAPHPQRRVQASGSRSTWLVKPCTGCRTVTICPAT